MGTYDDQLGSLLIGSWISSMLFMLIIRETIHYYWSFRNDGLVLKIYVAVAIMVDTLSLISDYAYLYLYTVSHWGEKEFLTKQYWPATLYLITTGITALLVQCFLVKRYYSLTKHRVIPVLIALCILVSFGGSLATVIIISQFSGYRERFMLKVPASIWLVMTAVTDILIAVVLIWQLYHMKTSFPTTEHLIKRLMRAAMQTGSTTSVLALCVLISYLVHNTSNVGVGICFILGRTYILTLLFNLNLRKIPKKEKGSSTVVSSERSHRSGSGAMPMDGIHVSRTAVVHMDPCIESQRSDDKIEMV